MRELYVALATDMILRHTMQLNGLEGFNTYIPFFLTQIIKKNSLLQFRQSNIGFIHSFRELSRLTR